MYAREKMSYSRGLGKKFLPKLNHPYPPSPRKSNGQPHRGGGRSGLDTLVSDCDPSKTWVARVPHVVVFKTKVWNSRLKILR